MSLALPGACAVTIPPAVSVSEKSASPKLSALSTSTQVPSGPHSKASGGEPEVVNVPSSAEVVPPRDTPDIGAVVVPASG